MNIETLQFIKFLDLPWKDGSNSGLLYRISGIDGHFVYYHTINSSGGNRFIGIEYFVESFYCPMYEEKFADKPIFKLMNR